MKKLQLLIILIIATFITTKAQPTLQTPTDLSNGVSLTPTLSWDVVVGAIDYTLQFSDDNTFTTTIIDTSLGDVQSYILGNPLTENTTYYWRVMDNVSGLYSSYFTLTTLVYPGSITLNSPANNSYNNPISANFLWNASTNTDTYTFELSDDSLFANIIDSQTGLVATNTSVTGLNNYTTYYWRVKGVNAYGEGAFSSFTFITLLADPTLLSPNDLSVHNPTNIALSWNSVNGASEYTIELAEDSIFTLNLQTFSNVSATNLLVNNLSNFTDYFWRVRAINVHGTSSFSNIWSFKTKLAAPVLAAPINNSINNSIVPLFDWNSVVGENPITYTLEIAEDISFTTGLITLSNLSADLLQFSPPAYVLDNNKQYFYRVSATDVYGTSDYSSVYTFKTVPEIIPVLGWPIGGSGAFNNPQLFSWYLNQFAPNTIYDFELSLNNDLTSPVITVQNINATTLSQNLTGLPGNTKLYWRITSKVSPTIVSHYSAIDSFTIQTPGFVALLPYPSYPVGGTTIYNSSVTLYWYLLAAGTGLTYEIEINNSGVFTGNPTYAGINNLYYTLGGLNGGDTYYWKIRSFNGLQYSDWSTVESFVVNGISTPVTPVQSWPISGSTVYTTSPTLYWYLNEYAVGLTYEIEYGTSNLFSGTPTVTGLTNQYYTITGLTPGTYYYWRVRSFNGTTYSSWSNTEVFEVYGAITNIIPVPSYPIGGTVVYSLNPTLSWYLNGSSTGLTFDVEYNSTGIFTGTPTVAGLTNLNYNLTNLTAGLTYYWKVRSHNGTNYSSWSTAESFIVIGSGGSLVPVLSWPVGGATVYSTSQNLNWYLNGSSTGLTYQIELSTTGAFSGTPNFVGINNHNYTITGLLEGSTVYWRVRSYNGVTPSAWSTPEYFVVYDSSAPLMPITGSPAGGITINTNAPIITWVMPAQNSGLLYNLEISESSDMDNPTLIENLTQPLFNSYGLESNKTYYWRVRSKTLQNNYSNYSNIASFEITDNVTSVEEKDIVPDNYFMSQNYPNPFNPSTTIKFGLPNSGNVKLSIYNMLGQEIKTLVNNSLNAGTYSIIWDGTNNNGIKVTSGAYLYRINANNYIETKKLVLIK